MQLIKEVQLLNTTS